MVSEGFPLTKPDFHALLKKAGITNNDFEQNEKELEIEHAADEEAAMRYGNRTNEPNNEQT